ncbi:MAG: hypothetical protein IKN79_10020 [Eubacterium sp.]|nr:hypothetical protein [Eubacterium sp.]
MDGKLEKDHWHPAFLGAMEIEFIEYKDKLTFEGVYQLSKEPLKVDLIVIKKQKDVHIENQIGRIFRGHNIFEYKSPDSGLTIDDFYKTIGYAFLYKAFGKTVDEISAQELTVTLVRDRKPEQLFQTIMSMGGSVEEKYPGIFWIDGIVNIPMQFVLTRSLEPELHKALRMLTKRLTEEDAERFIEMAGGFTEQGDKSNADALLQVSVSANRAVFESIKRRNPIMCEALRELMKEEIQEECKVAVGDERTRVATDMLKDGKPLEEISKYSKLTEKAIRALAKTIGVAVLS